jgi:hypothetical protein
VKKGNIAKHIIVICQNQMNLFEMTIQPQSRIPNEYTCLLSALISHQFPTDVFPPQKQQDLALFKLKDLNKKYEEQSHPQETLFINLRRIKRKKNKKF